MFLVPRYVSPVTGALSWQKVTKHGLCLVRIGQSWSKWIAKSGQSPTKAGRIRPNVAPISPTLVQTWAGESRPDAGQIWPNSVQICSTPPETWPNAGQVQPISGLISSTPAQFRTGLGEFRPSRNVPRSTERPEGFLRKTTWIGSQCATSPAGARDAKAAEGASACKRHALVLP